MGAVERSIARGAGSRSASIVGENRFERESRRADRGAGSQRSELGAIRLAYIAAETGARIVRERASIEPIEWLMSPRELFDGKRAIDACRHQTGFGRALVLHGIARGYDAHPDHLSGIPPLAFLSSAGAAYLSRGRIQDVQGNGAGIGEVGLYSSSISAETEHGQVQIFCAMIAQGPAQVRQRLRQRYGCLLEDAAIVRLGFDWSEPLACAMVSDAMAHVLMLASEDPTSSIATGLDFQVEQRFAI